MSVLTIREEERARWESYDESRQVELREHANWLSEHGETLTLTDVETARAFGF